MLLKRAFLHYVDESRKMLPSTLLIFWCLQALTNCVCEIMNFANWHTWIFFHKNAHKHNFSVSRVCETDLRNLAYIYLQQFLRQYLKSKDVICSLFHVLCSLFYCLESFLSKNNLAKEKFTGILLLSAANN